MYFIYVGTKVKFSNFFFFKHMIKYNLANNKFLGFSNYTTEYYEF